MTRKSLLVVTIVYTLVALPLIAHRSQDGVVFGRYSAGYFIGIVLFFIGLIVLTWALFHRDRIRKLIHDNIDRFIAFPLRDFVERHAGIILLAIIVCNASGFFLHFPPQNVFTNQPILQYEYSFHYHQVSTAVQALTQYGKHWSYDPSFAAGYLAGTLFDVQMELFTLFVYVLTTLGVSSGVAYNGFILLCFITYPLILYLAARSFCLPKSTTLLIVFTGVILWLTDFWISNFYISGMMPFAYSMYVSLLCAGLFYRYLTNQRLLHLCIFTAVLSLSLMLHVLMPFLIAVPVGVLYILRLSKTKASSHALIVLSVLIALAVNSWWIITVLRFLHYRTAVLGYLAFNFSDFIRPFFVAHNTAPYILFFVGLWGFWVSYAKYKALALTGIFAVSWYFIVGNFGSFLPLMSGLEPQRFVGPASVYALFGLTLGVEQLFSKTHLQEFNLKRWFPALVILLMLSLSYFSRWIEVPDDADPGTVEDYKPLANWLNTHTTKDARMAISDKTAWVYRGANLRALVDRELIGGYDPEMNLTHIFANFSGDTFMSHQLSVLAVDDFLKYCEIYNIKWVVSAEESVTSVMDSFSPRVKKVAEIPGMTAFTIYEVDIQPSFFISGSGIVSSSLNTISVRDASPGEVILGYHWLETLDTRPKLPIERVFVEDDPVGFIKVINGDTRDFVIYNSYEVNAPDDQKSFIDRWGRYLDVFRLSYWNP